MLKNRSKYDRLKYFTNNDSLVKELLTYTQNTFCPDGQNLNYKALQSEPQISDWDTYVEESNSLGVFETLQKYWVPFRFPIASGISKAEAFRSATLKGKPTDNNPLATGLELVYPDKLKLYLHDSLAGKIPVLVTACREDFESVVSALAYKNEPREFPDSMGAIMIKGINNWSRLRKLQRDVKYGSVQNYNLHPQLLKNHEFYQDRIIVLGRTPYSAVPAAALNLSKEDWLDKSLTIRLEHECAHYLTLRHFGVMSNNLHDELIADYMGIAAAKGHFDATWFLHFMGLENYPVFRNNGRLKNYLGKPPLTKSAFEILQKITVKAAENLEQFDSRVHSMDKDADRSLRLLSLCKLNLMEIASEDGVDLLFDEFYHNQTKNERRVIN